MISSLVEELWKTFKNGSSRFILDARLATVIENLDAEARKNVVAAFLLYAENERASWMFGLGKLTLPHPWQGDLGAAFSDVRARRESQQ